MDRLQLGWKLFKYVDMFHVLIEDLRIFFIVEIQLRYSRIVSRYQI